MTMALAVERPSHVKVATASLIGTAIEWYDFFLYGTAAALIFNKLFFPTFDPMVGTLLAFATYALGFVARPLGGLVFGHFGDTIGRKTMLYLTLLIMGVATAVIGLLPTYDTLGIWAAILLIACRLLQGFGECGHYLKNVAHDAIIRNYKNWRVLVFVDRHNRACAFHPYYVLNRPTNPKCKIEFRRHRLPRTADLPFHREPTFVANRP